MIHELKTLPQYFEAVKNGSKTFEIRKNDRGFQAGDTLILKEYCPERIGIGGSFKSELSRFNSDGYSGNKIRVTVTYLFHAFGLEPEYCVMGIKKINRQKCEVE